MKLHKNHPDTLLDEALAAAGSETPDARAEREAAGRVWAKLAQAAREPSSPDTLLADSSINHSPITLTSCADYQALMPAHVAGELPEAQALLVADHSRECVPCRRTLNQARHAATAGTSGATARPAPVSRATTSSLWQQWTRIAAALLLVAGAVFGGFYVVDQLDTNPEVARVAALDGQLLRVSGASTTPLAAGNTFAEGELVRTGKDSGAVLRLGDGSEVEIAERSEISIRERRSGTTIEVNRGSVIVEAAKQHDHLYVATEDCLVAVTGTIFAVNHGIKGSRVSVVEGEVRVEQGRSRQLLHPGEQAVTHAGLALSPIEQEVSWSRNYDQYVTLLREFKALNREWNQTLARTGLRYESRLLSLAPAGTVVYVGLPNISEELVEMEQTFAQRLAENPELAQWWEERMGGTEANDAIRDVLERMSGLGQYLGEEIVLAMPLVAGSDEAEPGPPVLLAEVVSPSAFAAVLAAEVERLNAENEGEHLVIVLDPAQAPDGDDHLLLWQAGDLFVAANTGEKLQAVAAVLANPAGNPFVGSGFHGRLAEAYSQGAQWLLGVDAGSLFGSQTSEDDAQALAFTGFDAAQHLIVERKSNGETVHTGAVLSFAGARQGVSSWLAEPGPMGSLDFVSAEATFVTSFVVEEPASILEQIFRFVEATDPDFRDELSRFEQEHNVRIIDDLAAPMGGEFTFALDGPALPKPAWKAISEVYDPVRFQQSVEWALEQARQAASEHGGEVEVTLSKVEVGGRTYYHLTTQDALGEVFYTFDGGYFIAAPSRALVDRALAIRDSGYSLADSPVFTGLLPQDGFVHFSGLVFTHLGPVADTLLSAAGNAGMSEEQRQALAELDLGAPTLTCAYGEADRIRIVSTGQGGLLGSRLGGLLGLSSMMPEWAAPEAADFPAPPVPADAAASAPTEI